jgi:hypothetical protein
MKNPHSSTTSDFIVRNKKMFGRPFCFPIGICSYSFCRAFDGASFEKNSRFYHVSKPTYLHFGTPGIQEN